MNAPSLLTLPVARASVPSNMSKAPPMKTTIPPSVQYWRPTRIAPAAVIANPMSVSASGVRPARPMARAMGSKIALMRDRDSLEMRQLGDPQDLALARGDLAERLRAERADRLAADAS